MSNFQLTLKNYFTPEDKARSDYAYVPFTLPAPATRLHIRYRFSAEMSSDEVSGGNVVDIGLFDPRGHEFPGGAGFRGWSGSARREFFVTPTEATPGYLPGPLPAGEYQVILGLYRVWEQGVDVEIEVTAEIDPSLTLPAKKSGEGTVDALRPRPDISPPPVARCPQRLSRGELEGAAEIDPSLTLPAKKSGEGTVDALRPRPDISPPPVARCPQRLSRGELEGAAEIDPSLTLPAKKSGEGTVDALRPRPDISPPPVARCPQRLSRGELEGAAEIDPSLTLPAKKSGEGTVDALRPRPDISPPPVAFPRGELEGGLWLRGDLQSHTVHSDARGTLEQLIGKARAIGLDFLAVTDHNTVSHHPFLPALADERLLLIPGQEATTYYGHMNIWNTSRWCDFRCRSDADMAAVIALAHAHGGICSINHPKQGGPAWEYTTDLPVHAMEVWQGPWPHRNTESLALWDRLLAQGRRLPAVGGSDYHCPSGEDTNLLRLGQPTTWVKVHERSVEAILEAIVAGRSCISATPEGPRIDLSAAVNGETVGMGDVVEGWNDGMMRVMVEVLGGRGKTLHLIVDGHSQFQAQIEDDETVIEAEVSVHRYVRAELVGDMDREALPPQAPLDLDLRDWRWALSNPIYVERAD